MHGQALYRKYRPATFAEVLGQREVVRTLEGAIAQGKVAHAYLFSGSRGTGKTSLARIFARAIGTDDRDLHEIDAASNNGVDEVRALREEVYVLPFASRYKVYILDEAHMLSKQAWNALLKTLEEPPAHVVFILATTELTKVPDTILSRCQCLSFRVPDSNTLKELVSRVAREEGFDLEPAGAELLALLADGSFRDAHSILERVLAGVEGTSITAEKVAEITGSPRSALLIGILEAVAARNLDTALVRVREVAQAGNSARTTLDLLLRVVRMVLLVRSAPSLRTAIAGECSQEEYERVQYFADKAKGEINSRFLMRLLDAHARIGATYTPELPLELALIEHLEECVQEKPAR